MTFDSVGEANQVRQSMKELEQQGLLRLEDAAVITKDEHGKVHAVNEMGSAVKGGAIGGGLLGLLLFGLFPIAGIAVGALSGAAIGKMVEGGVDKEFVKEVSESLQPGHSALFLIAKEANAPAVRAALQPHRGKLYHSNLSSEAEDSLRSILEKGGSV
jgi:uncharacterized membrane protein